jgi:predicted membrane channel-forming protein YqfA (hemolysin III family)
MFVLPPNFILLVCVGIVVGIIGFLIYGFKKGFENIFHNE